MNISKILTTNKGTRANNGIGIDNIVDKGTKIDEYRRVNKDIDKGAEVNKCAGVDKYVNKSTEFININYTESDVDSFK
ncbi:13781_t:CDS:2, partial [Cetraspora pellucida]